MQAKYGSVIILLLLLATGCRSYFSSGVEHSIPPYERIEKLDKDGFIARLDTTAIDDWEGVWLMVGPNVYCYIAIERINSPQRDSYYTHRLRTWQTYHPTPFHEFDAGIVIGYLEAGVTEDEKRVTMMRGFLNLNKQFVSSVWLDKSRSHIFFGKQRFTKGNYDRLGMKRIFPIRSWDEKPYKVRYL